MKVATFNTNNINKRLDNLLAWLAKAEPGVVSLQELKAEQEAFPVNAFGLLRSSLTGTHSSSVLA
jgi:exodeoxyribonuclease-3